MPPGQVIGFIIGTVVILFGAYYVTYFIGMKASGRTTGAGIAGIRNRNIVVLDRYAVSRDKSFYIIEVAGNVYFIGVADHGMTLFDTFDGQEFAELTLNDDDGMQVPWTDTPVGQYGNKLTKAVVAFVARKKGKPPAAPGEDEKKADFAETLKNAEASTEADDTEEAGAPGGGSEG